MPYLNLFDLYNVRFVCNEIYRLVDNYPRFKKNIWYSKNIISNEKWFEIIETTFDRFLDTFKTHIKICDVELLVKYYIEKIKNDLMILNVLSYMLFCKRYCDQNFDSRKCSRNYINDVSINKSLEYHFQNICVFRIF